MTCTRLNRGLYTNSDVKLKQKNNIGAAYYFRVCMLDKWEVGSYEIILSLPPTHGGGREGGGHTKRELLCTSVPLTHQT